MKVHKKGLRTWCPEAELGDEVAEDVQKVTCGSCRRCIAENRDNKPPAELFAELAKEARKL